MKEIKNFFENNNRLNKGYIKIRNPNELDNSFYRKKFEHILPPIDVMEAYENIHPGTLSKLIDMAEKEQVHRHSMDLKNLAINEKLAHKAKLYALLLIVFLLVIFTILSFYGHFASAGAIILLVAVVSCVFSYNKLARKNYIRK